MKRYLLLRKNRESGPFTFEELICQDLGPLDLIWIEGESRSWAHSTELEELRVWVKEPENEPIREAVKTSERPPVSMEGIPLPALPPLRERNWEAPKEKKRIWRRRISRSTNAKSLLRLTAVFILMAPSAFIIKKLVDAFSGTDTYSPPVVASFVPEKKLEDSYSMAVAHHNTGSSVSVENSLLKPDIKEITGKISVKTNDYTVKILGGIEDLKLTVVNQSPWFVDGVMITLRYYKGNGDLTGTEQVEVKKMDPGAIKIVPVPPVNKGVRVSYSIDRIQSGQQTYTLKQV
jgi:hypothetical protein